MYPLKLLSIVMTIQSMLLPIIRSETATQLVENLLSPTRYNKRERPYLADGKPVLVDVDVYLDSMSDISEISMDYAINIYLRQRWRDPRLSFENHPNFTATLTLSYEMHTYIWLPDLFIKNERVPGSFHNVMVPNILLTLSPSGDVLMSRRISSRLSCHMGLQEYPLDIQKCNMEFESFGYTTRDLQFRWRNIEQPVQINTEMELPEFNLTSVSNTTCSVQYTTGTFSCIRATFNLTRLFQYYLIQVFVPSILIVILSWVSFWIDIHAVPARISLGLLTVLTITTQASGVSSKLPRVSYVKAIDVWMFTNIVFVFGALIEYSIVNVMARSHSVKVQAIKKYQESEKNKQMVQDKSMDFVQEKSSCKWSPKETDEKKMNCFQKLKFNRALLVDVVSRILFPGAYLIFNILYWVMYL